MIKQLQRLSERDWDHICSLLFPSIHPEFITPEMIQYAINRKRTENQDSLDKVMAIIEEA